MSISHSIWQRIPRVLRDRPFGIYVATIVFGLGVYGLTNSDDLITIGSSSHWLIVIVSIYFIFASIVVILSLVVNAKAHPVFCVFGEMYGWLFIASAALATAVMIALQGATGTNPAADGGWTVFLVFFWSTLFVSSGVRSIDLLMLHRKIR